MNTKVVSNTSSRTKYFSIPQERFLEPDELRWSEADLVNASYENHLLNSFSYIPNPRKYLPVIAGVVPIHPKSCWTLQHGQLFPAINESFPIERKGFRDLEATIRQYASRVRQKKIAVEISGGLDTALILGALKMCNVSPLKIGVVSERYEFRTEAFIQREIMHLHSDSIILSENETFPFFNIHETPLHTVPDKTSLFYSFFQKTADALADQGVQLLLNGVGGDALLAEPIKQISQRWMLNEWWSCEFIFFPRGIDYRSAFSLFGVRNALSKLRQDKDEDIQKLWARRQFSNWLPRELNLYSYKSSHDVIFVEGLQDSLEEILEIARITHKIHKNSKLNPDKIYKLLKNFNIIDHSKMIELLASVSFCAWISVHLKRL